MNKFDEAVNDLSTKEAWDKADAEKFVDLVTRYLDARGYFMGDFNIHNLPVPNDFVKYSERGFGTWIMDFAQQYNMEHGVEYKVEKINNHTDYGNN